MPGKFLACPRGSAADPLAPVDTTAPEPRSGQFGDQGRAQRAAIRDAFAIGKIEQVRHAEYALLGEERTSLVVPGACCRCD